MVDFVKSKAKKKIKKKNPLKWIIFSFLITCFLLVLAFIIFLNIKNYGRLNLILVNDSVTLLSYDQEKKTINILTLPSDAYINLAYGKGQLKLDSLFKFDQISKGKGKIFKESLREFLGLPVDGWIKIPSSYKLKTLDDFLNLQKNEFAFLKLRSSLSPLDLQKFYFQLRKVRQDKITFIDTLKSGIFDKEKLPDESEILRADSIDLDNLLADKFYEWQILKENYSIAIKNGGKTPGLATRASRIIGNIGGKVIIIGESPERVVNCLINVYPKDKESYTIKRLKKIFNCELDYNSPEEARADIILTVGLNYEKEIKGE